MTKECWNRCLNYALHGHSIRQDAVSSSISACTDVATIQYTNIQPWTHTGNTHAPATALGCFFFVCLGLEGFSPAEKGPAAAAAAAAAVVITAGTGACLGP